MTAAEREDLIVSHLGWVRRVAEHLKRRLPSEAMDIEDLVQEGCIGLIIAAQRYQAGRNSKFEAYAYMRVRGAMLDSIRRRHWITLTASQLRPTDKDDRATLKDHEPRRSQHGLHFDPAIAPTIEEDIQSRQRAAALRRAAADLSQREQRILLLYYSQERTEAQIAPALGLSATAVGKIRRGALEKLRRECRALKLAA